MSRFLDLLLEKSSESEEARKRYERLHGEASAAKKTWECLRDEIDGLLKRRREELSGDRLPFGDTDDDSDGGVDVHQGPSFVQVPENEIGENGRHEYDSDVIDVEIVESQPALPGPTLAAEKHPEFASDAWKAVLLDTMVEHGLSADTINLLYDHAKLRTVGDLAAWSSSGKLLTDIKGIGDTKAAEIEEALDCFWSDWSRRQAVWPEETEEPKPKRSRRKKSSDGEAA